MKKYIKLLSTTIISFITVISIIITNSDKLLIKAASTIRSLATSYNQVYEDNIELGESKTLYEVEELRDIDKKVFINDKGLAELAIYNDAVHYFKDGKFIDIDNTLVYDKEIDGYTNLDNSYQVKLPKFLLNNKIEINFDDYSINFGVKDIKNSVIKPIDKIKSKDLKDLNKVTTGVYYKNIQKSVDLKYTLSGQGIKEEIILNEYIQNFAIVFEYELDNLVLVKNEDKIYFVNNENEIISRFNDLIMIDSNGNVSDKVKIEIKNIEEDKYELKVTADEEFLREASYPLIIDPSIYLRMKNLTIQNKSIYRDNFYGTTTIY